MTVKTTTRLRSIVELTVIAALGLLLSVVDLGLYLLGHEVEP